MNKKEEDDDEFQVLIFKIIVPIIVQVIFMLHLKIKKGDNNMNK